MLAAVAEPPDHVIRDDDGRVVAYLDQQEQTRTLAAREYLQGVAERLRQQYPGAHISTDVRLGQPASGDEPRARGGRERDAVGAGVSRSALLTPCGLAPAAS